MQNKPASIYYAHSGNPNDYSNRQTQRSHAHNEGDMAAEFAVFFAAGEIARCTGQLHDLGKYTPEFNQRLHGGKFVDHATAGAKIAFERQQQTAALSADDEAKIR